MSATQKDPPEAWLRRAKTTARIVKRVKQTLGPFTPIEVFSFDPRKGFATYDPIYDPHTRKRPMHKRVKKGFWESLFTELPRNLQRRYWLLGNEKRVPADNEYRKMERAILGHARRKLTRELTRRIKMLPHLVGNGPNGVDEEERRKIKNLVKSSMQKKTEDGKKPTKRKAISEVARDQRLSERQIWRIVLGH